METREGGEKKREEPYLSAAGGVLRVCARGWGVETGEEVGRPVPEEVILSIVWRNREPGGDGRKSR